MVLDKMRTRFGWLGTTHRFALISILNDGTSTTWMAKIV